MPTRMDVARLARVSPSTVSRVVNDNGYVAAGVRKRVTQAIEQLNYVPNRAARSLRLRRYRQIACIAPSIENPFYHAMVAGIEEVALESGYTFSWYSLTKERMDHLQVIFEGFYDGIIFLAALDTDEVVDLHELAQKYPLCLYSDSGRFDGIPNVYIDLRAAMRENIKRLIDCGHQRILFLGHEFTALRDNPRYEGYLEALRNKGVEVHDALIQILPHHKDTISNGYERVKELVATGLDFTAVAATNDLVAAGALRALREAGLDVPKDVSVTGVDDIEISSLITPALTTIRVPKREIGNQLMRLLLKQIDGGPLHETSIGLSTELIVRESVHPLGLPV